MAAEEQNANEGTNPSIRASRRRPTQGDASSKPQHERGERDDGAPRVLRYLRMSGRERPMSGTGRPVSGSHGRGSAGPRRRRGRRWCGGTRSSTGCWRRRR